MYGCVITEPVSSDADFGVLFMHNEGYSTMCGHGIIAVATVVLETGMLSVQEPETEIRIDTPAGMISARATIQNNAVTRVSFLNVPSYVLALDEVITIPGLGRPGLWWCLLRICGSSRSRSFMYSRRSGRIDQVWKSY
jgi:trans-L-3-hydroxyproline dehydratase